MSCSKPSPYFFLPVILVQVDLNFSFLKGCFSRSGLAFFFNVFILAKSNLALFAPCGEPYFCSCNPLLIVDFNSDTPTWRVFSTWLDVVNHIFLYHGEDHLIIHHCCPTWTFRPFYVAGLTSVFFFFLRMYQTVDLTTPNVPAISLMDLFLF